MRTRPDDAGERREVEKMSERKIFVNLTAHQLSDAQVEEIKKFADEIVKAEAVLSREMIQKLRQCPSDPTELVKLAYEVSEALVKFAREMNAELYVHLPTGSPAFMWALADVFPYTFCTPVFSHSRREVQEIKTDGTVIKKSVFRFEGFIFPDGR